MFQYAFGRAAALRNGTEFKMDLSWFDKPRHRSYGLSRFNIVATAATGKEIAHLLYRDRTAAGRRLRLLGQKLRPRYRRNFVREDLSRFDPNLLRVGPDAYVWGYFGSEDYFRDAAGTIRKELSVKGEASGANAEMIRRVEDCESVCLSVRRGDFVGNPLYDVCGPDYFARAAEHVAARAAGAHVFVFCDDNAWARANLKLAMPHTFVTHNFPDFYEDLRLMTHCKHHVIPNSTFSWWAAWLADKPGKIVVAPGRWLNLEALNDQRYADLVEQWCPSGTMDLSHVYPEGWMTL
jgi:hypothetical protein